MNSPRHPIISIPALLAALAAGCAPPQPDAGNRPRIVSLAPSLTEIVCTLEQGHLLVGRTTACNFPPAVVTNIPVIGDFGVPSMERLLAARPTLVLDVDLADETIAHKMRELGIRRERIRCDLLEDIPPAVTAIGKFLACPARAEKIADDLNARILELRRSAPPNPERPRVFAAIWSDPLTTAGRASFVSQLIGLAGGNNTGDEVDRAYFQVSPEWVVSRNPQVILCLYPSETGSAARQLAARAGWARIDAVMSGRIYDGLDLDVLLRPGPRVLEGIEDLHRVLRAGPAPNEGNLQRGSDKQP